MANTPIIFDSIKHPAEYRTVTFDFNSQLAGTTLSGTPTVVCTVWGSNNTASDPTPANVLNGGATLSGGSVLQPIKGGVKDVDYLLICTATTSSAARILQKQAVLAVR